MNDKKLFLLDAYALIFRAYYAFIKNPRINSKGENTSAVFGFLNTLFDVIKKERPTHLAVAFDVAGGCFRHEEYAEYKANRDATPEGIKTAVPHIKEILQALGIPVIGITGYEADDVVGTLAKQAEKEGYKVYMMTSDKDYAQLVSENIFVYKPASRGNDIEIWDIAKVQEKFEVERPEQVIDFLGMMGDSSDNIPGLPGVGEKTAKQFIKEYGSMENLFEHTDEIKGKLKEKIIEGKELGLLSKRLATIDLNVPVDFKEEEFLLDPPNVEEIHKLFSELEFRNMISNFEKTYNLNSTSEVEQKAQPKASASVQDSEQGSLFDIQDNEIAVPSYGFATLENTDHFYQVIDSKMALKLLVEKLQKQPNFCFDTETTSLNEREANLVGISISYEKGKAYYIPFVEGKENDWILEELKPLFINPDIVKIGHNLKYDFKVLKKHNVELKAPMFDTMIAHYLLNPDGRHSMDILAEIELNYKPVSIESLIGKKGKNQKLFSEVPLEEQKEYAGEDADITYQLYLKFLPLLKENKLYELFTTIEMPLMEVLANMEWEGINLDTSFLKDISIKLDTDLLALEKTIYTLAEEEFNINSPKQLGIILFEKLKIDGKPKKTKTGQYATSEDILNKLAHKHEIMQAILEYRQLQKLKSTYVDALPEEIEPSTRRIHTTFAQTVAATGRLASNKPNLQNIPIRTKRGREVRKAFIAKDKNHKIISADYSQVELRIIASMSEDPIMIESFNNGEDFHTATASKVFNTPIKEVTKEQRSYAKTVNFGIIYGVSAFGLSEQTDLSRSESKELIDTYYETYPTLKQYIANQVEIAREQGYVETLLGRRRYLPDIHSNNAVVRSHAERNATNAPIQGTAADIIKIAMINIEKKLEDNNLATKLLLQVHDELIFDAPNNEVEKVEKLIKETMEEAIKLKVPLLAEVGVGDNWLEAH